MACGGLGPNHFGIDVKLDDTVFYIPGTAVPPIHTPTFGQYISGHDHYLPDEGSRVLMGHLDSQSLDCLAPAAAFPHCPNRRISRTAI